MTIVGMPKALIDNTLGRKPSDDPWLVIGRLFTCGFHSGLRGTAPEDDIFENVIDIVCPSPTHKLLLEWLMPLCTQVNFSQKLVDSVLPLTVSNNSVDGQSTWGWTQN
jgi:hypothetical protein